MPHRGSASSSPTPAPTRGHLLGGARRDDPSELVVGRVVHPGTNRYVGFDPDRRVEIEAVEVRDEAAAAALGFEPAVAVLLRSGAPRIECLECAAADGELSASIHRAELGGLVRSLLRRALVGFLRTKRHILFDDAFQQQLEATLLVEVLSDSSEAYDRGEKFAHYRRLPSLQEYVLVSHLTSRIEVWRRNESSRWELAQEACAGEQAELASIACALQVDEVYADPLAHQA